tara:strand:- start:311 stop:439 length:129 start_codon:yes stop_codon:yes gene_type:complete
LLQDLSFTKWAKVEDGFKMKKNKKFFKQNKQNKEVKVAKKDK